MSEDLQREQPDNFQSLLIGAGVALVLSGVPFLNLINFLCCMGVALGGATAVWHFTNTYSLTLTPGEGFKQGAIACLIGGLALYVIQMILLVAFGYQSGKEWIDVMKNFVGNDPAARAQFEAQMAEQAREATSIKNIAIGLVTTLILYPLFGGAGGAIAASLFKKGNAE
jgi:hypothetical protein